MRWRQDIARSFGLSKEALGNFARHSKLMVLVVAALDYGDQGYGPLDACSDESVDHNGEYFIRR